MEGGSSASSSPRPRACHAALLPAEPWCSAPPTPASAPSSLLADPAIPAVQRGRTHASSSSCRWRSKNSCFQLRPCADTCTVAPGRVRGAGSARARTLALLHQLLAPQPTGSCLLSRLAAGPPHPKAAPRSCATAPSPGASSSLHLRSAASAWADGPKWVREECGCSRVCRTVAAGSCTLLSPRAAAAATPVAAAAWRCSTHAAGQLQWQVKCQSLGDSLHQLVGQLA